MTTFIDSPPGRTDPLAHADQVVTKHSHPLSTKIFAEAVCLMKIAPTTPNDTPFRGYSTKRFLVPAEYNWQ